MAYCQMLMAYHSVPMAHHLTLMAYHQMLMAYCSVPMTYHLTLMAYHQMLMAYVMTGSSWLVIGSKED